MESSPRFGNCFSFNSNVSGNSSSSWTSSLPGSVLGLNIVLNIQQNVYMINGLTPSAGARVTIHSTAVRPLVDEFGHDIEPAKATNFALERVNMKISVSQLDILLSDRLLPRACALGH